MSEEHKPLFFDVIKWVILISIAVSIIWLIFAFLYSDTYAKNKEARTKQEATSKSLRTKFRKEENTDPLAVLEPKKLASLIRALSIAGIVIQALFLYGIWTDNRYISTAFVIWAFLMAIFAFKIAVKDHLFWIQAIWCLGVGLLSTQFVHSLYQVEA